MSPQTERILDFSAGNFQVVMEDLPEFVNNIVSIEMPGIRVDAPNVANPFISIPVPGDHIDRDDLSIQFLVNENYENYLDIYSWLIAISFPRSTEQYTQLINEKLKVKKVKYDLSIIVLSNKFNPIGKFTFVDCFPSSLSSLVFETGRSDGYQHTATSVFKYSYFYFNPTS